MSTNDFIECPCCDAGGIRVHNGKIDRHEYGLRYVPYKLYHRFEGRKKPVTELMRRNLCPASGKTPEQAEIIHQSRINCVDVSNKEGSK